MAAYSTLAKLSAVIETICQNGRAAVEWLCMVMIRSLCGIVSGLRCLSFLVKLVFVVEAMIPQLAGVGRQLFCGCLFRRKIIHLSSCLPVFAGSEQPFGPIKVSAKRTYLVGRFCRAFVKCNCISQFTLNAVQIVLWSDGEVPESVKTTMKHIIY